MVRQHLSRLILLSLLLGFAFLLGGCGKTEQAATDNKGGGSGGGSSALTAEELALIPPEAIFAGHFKVGDLWRTHGEAFLKQLLLREPGAMEDMERDLGYTVQDIDRILLIMPDLQNEPIALIVLHKPADKEKIKKALLKTQGVAFAPVGDATKGDGPSGTPAKPAGPEVETKELNGKTYYRLKQQYSDRSLCFLGERGILYGRTPTVETLLQADPKAAPGPVAEQVRKEAANHDGVVCVALEKLPPVPPQSPMPPAFRELVKAKLGVYTLDLDDRIRFVARMTYAEAGQATKAVEHLKTLVTLGQTLVPQLQKELRYDLVENPEPPHSLIRLVPHGLTALKAIDINAQGTDLTVKLTVESDRNTISQALPDMIYAIGNRASATFEETASSLGGPGVDSRPTPFRVRPTTAANMLKIAAALKKYKEQHGSYPPPAIYGKDGTPLLSWRVALLPYMGHEELYKKFKLDEPWNSKHNKDLMREMPHVYGGYRMTGFRTYSGPGAAHDGKDGSKPGDFTNGGAGTFLVVEADRQVEWSRPEHLILASDQPLPRHGEGSRKNFFAIMADGTVRFFKEPLPEATARKLVTKSGAQDMSNLGEIVKE